MLCAKGMGTNLLIVLLRRCTSSLSVFVVASCISTLNCDNNSMLQLLQCSSLELKSKSRLSEKLSDYQILGSTRRLHEIREV